MTTARYGTHEVELPAMVEDPRTGRFKVVRGGVDSDTQRDERRTLRRERGVKGALPIVQFSAPAPPQKSPYDSKLEAAYAVVLKARLQAGDIAFYEHHPFSRKLPGQKNRYRPDFLLYFPDGHVEIHEVKGWSKNRREGITKLKTAAGITPWAVFYLITMEDRQWIEELV